VATASSSASTSAATISRRTVQVLGGIAGAALLLNIVLWDRLSNLQESLARQAADAGGTAAEVRILVRQTQEGQRDVAARQAVLEAKLGEVALQRSQLEELMQSLSRSRDENLVVDIESAVRLAQQQAQLTGSAEPLLAALRTAEQRVQRAPQARLAPLLRALGRDIARIKSTPLADTPTLLVRLDEIVRLVDDLPLANAVGPTPAQTSAVPSAVAASASAASSAGHGDTSKTSAGAKSETSWWTQVWTSARGELRDLVRVSRIDHPDAVLLTPEQSFFVRENLKLVLLNARLGLLAHQPDAARADVGKAAVTIEKYFDGNTRRVRAITTLLQQTREQMKSLELPRVDDTLAALSTAAAGR
jgi:uroporphyrin-3 C-methyltransferase